jgi:hypothetical protein
VPLSINVGLIGKCVEEMTKADLPLHKIQTLIRLSEKNANALVTNFVDRHMEFITIIHKDPGRYRDNIAHTPFYKIGRSMFETNTIPSVR